MMLQVAVGKISVLSAIASSALLEQDPVRSRRASWLAGRVLLSTLFSPDPVPEIVYGPEGKPHFKKDIPRWFNISHSGDDIVLVVSDQGEVGCDLEVIRPRNNWQRIASAVFSDAERLLIESVDEKEQITTFWRIWTRKEAMLKQSGSSVWKMKEIDSTTNQGRFVSQYCLADTRILAICTPQPHTVSVSNFIFAGYNQPLSPANLISL